MGVKCREGVTPLPSCGKITLMDKEWVVVCSANGQVEGNIIKGKLESEGIPVIVRQEAIGKFYAFTVDGLGEAKILVPSIFKEKALEIIGEIDLIPPSGRGH